MPSILGISSTIVTKRLTEEHVQREVTCAVERAIRSRVAKTLQEDMLLPGTIFLVLYNSSIQNKAVERVEEIVVEAQDHIVK